MRRTVWRTSSSAVAVTVQVLRTIRAASAAVAAEENPFAVRPASMAAPSAWEARQPKFFTKNRSTVLMVAGGGRARDIAYSECLRLSACLRMAVRSASGSVRLRCGGMGQPAEACDWGVWGGQPAEACD